jgi:hypothetical protein
VIGCCGAFVSVIWNAWWVLVGKIKIKVHAVDTSRVGGRVSLCAGSLAVVVGSVVAAWLRFLPLGLRPLCLLRMFRSFLTAARVAVSMASGEAPALAAPYTASLMSCSTVSSSVESCDESSEGDGECAGSE